MTSVSALRQDSTMSSPRDSKEKISVKRVMISVLPNMAEFRRRRERFHGGAGHDITGLPCR